MNHSKGSKRNSTKTSRPRRYVSTVSPTKKVEKIGPKLDKKMTISPDDDELEENDDDDDDDKDNTAAYPTFHTCMLDLLSSNELDVSTLVGLMTGHEEPNTHDNKAYTWLRKFVDDKYTKTDAPLSLTTWDEASHVPFNREATWRDITIGIYDYFQLETLQDFRNFSDSYFATGTSIDEIRMGLHLSVCRSILVISETPPLEAFPFPAVCRMFDPFVHLQAAA